ncbi:hypothetical protein FBU59_004895, partial [Linderina macrospora]
MADFLARERAALGEDADLFQSGSPSASKSPEAASADVFGISSAGNGDLLGNSFIDAVPAAEDIVAAAFEAPAAPVPAAPISNPTSSAKTSPAVAQSSGFLQEWE